MNSSRKVFLKEYNHPKIEVMQKSLMEIKYNATLFGGDFVKKNGTRELFTTEEYKFFLQLRQDVTNRKSRKHTIKFDNPVELLDFAEGLEQSANAIGYIRIEAIGEDGEHEEIVFDIHSKEFAKFIAFEIDDFLLDFTIKKISCFTTDHIKYYEAVRDSSKRNPNKPREFKQLWVKPGFSSEFLDVSVEQFAEKKVRFTKLVNLYYLVSMGDKKEHVTIWISENQARAIASQIRNDVNTLTTQISNSLNHRNLNAVIADRLSTN